MRLIIGLRIILGFLESNSHCISQSQGMHLFKLLSNPLYTQKEMASYFIYFFFNLKLLVSNFNMKLFN